MDLVQIVAVMINGEWVRMKGMQDNNKKKKREANESSSEWSWENKQYE